MGILDYNTTPSSNTSINGIGIQGTNNVQNFDNAIRQLMADVASDVTRHVSKSGNYTAVKADNAQLIEFTASATLSLTAAATLTDGWSCVVKANGGTVTIDPSSSEKVNGASTKAVPDGSFVLLYCDGTGFHTVGSLPTGTFGHVVGYLDGNNTWSGTQTYTGIITSNRTLSSSNQIQNWQQGYELYSDNTGSVGTTRLWIDAPDDGEFYIGPRTGGDFLARVEARSEDLRVTTSSGTVATISSGGISVLIGQVLASAGSVAAPSLSFANDSNTGFYNPANGEIAVSCNGAQQLRINPSATYFDAINDTTTGSAANVFINSSSGLLARSTSSLRYKENVRDYERGLSDLLTLRAVRYNGKSDGDTEFAGLIAEEVHAAGLSEFVVYDDEGKPDALHYPHMVALLINAVKELETRVKELEAA